MNDKDFVTAFYPDAHTEHVHAWGRWWFGVRAGTNRHTGLGLAATVASVWKEAANTIWKESFVLNNAEINHLFDYQGFDNYVLCRLTKKLMTGEVVDTRYIPTDLAVPGTKLEVMLANRWCGGWVVTEVIGDHPENDDFRKEVRLQG